MVDRTDDPNDLDSGPGGVSRRGFLGSVLPAAVGVAVAKDALSAPVQAAPVSQFPAAEPSKLTLVVNGRTHKVLVEPRDTLLVVLREKLGLTGTKPGCERGECGACSVLIDGVPRYSCLTLALEAEGTAGDDGRGAHERRGARAGPEGLRRGGRLPVRLLHARTGRSRPRVSSAPTPSRRSTRSASA